MIQRLLLIPFAFLFCAYLFPSSSRLSAQEKPLHSVIDELTNSELSFLNAARESYSLLLRRLSLDLRNVVPTANELDEFSKDMSPDRWSNWIDRFQKDPLATERLVDWYDKTLMQRRPHQQVDHGAWQSMLRRYVDERVPLDQFLQKIVTSVWWNQSQRAEQRFFLDRGGDAGAIARDVGRVFFGRDLQCAQCHNHPQIDGYLQADYQGLLAFVSSSSLLEATFKDDKGADQKIQMYVERAAADSPFESVFDKGIHFRTASRVPGQPELMETYLEPNDRYLPMPQDGSLPNVPAAPKVSRRSALAAGLTGKNQAFADNWANRVWAMMMGRGLVHPLDMHHADNPPSNPTLLKALADALIQSNFDVPYLMREIAKSETYQRGRSTQIDTIANNDSNPSLAEVRRDMLQQIETNLSQMQDRLTTLGADEERLFAVYEEQQKLWRDVQQERTKVRAEFDSADVALSDSIKKAGEALTAQSVAKEALETTNRKIGLLEEAFGKLEQVRSLTPDDPELQSAITIAKNKSEAARAELPAKTEALAALQAAYEAAAQAKENQRAAWQAIVDRLKPIEERLSTVDQQFVEARKNHELSLTRLRSTERSKFHLERIKNWLSALEQIEAQNLIKDQQQVLLLAQKQKINEADQAKLAANQLYETALNSLVQHKAKIAAQEGLLETIRNEIQQLRSTMEAVESSAQLIVQSERLLGAKEAIAESIENRRSQQEANQKMLEQLVVDQQLLQTQVDNRYASLQAASDQLGMIQNELRTMEEASQAHETSIAKLKDQASSLKASIDASLQDFQHAAVERALSPEQFAWSILRTTGVLQSYTQAKSDELEKQAPLPGDAEPSEVSARRLQATRLAMNELQGNVNVFTGLYSSGVGQTSDEFFASPDQALFLSNGWSVYAWAAPNGSNVTSQVLATPDAQQAATLLYQSLLSRVPSPEHTTWLAQQITQAGEAKNAVVQELVWGILSSAEFRFYP